MTYNRKIIGEPAYIHLGEYANNEWTEDGQELNRNPITITSYDSSDELDACVIGTSDGKWWFADNNDTFEIPRRINIGYIKYDENRGYIYRNGRDVKELA